MATTVAVETGLRRVEAVAKVTGAARYAGEIRLPRRAYGWVVQSTIARGAILTIDTDPRHAGPGVLAVLTHANAPRLADAGDGELRLLQSERVHYRGEPVGLVVAESLEEARAAAETLEVRYTADDHDVILRTDHPRLYAPDHINANLATDTLTGDVATALSGAAVSIDETYSTPAEHNNPMEPHTATAHWQSGRLIVYDSNQGAASVARTLAQLFALEPDAIQVLSEHVGGGFGSKGSARPPAVLAAMASQLVGRPVCVALSRQQLFAFVGYRTPTIQRLRLGSDSVGRLVAIDHAAYSQTSNVQEFAEQTASISRILYATPTLRTSHRVLALDVPTPRWMRAPGDAPGSFGLESAMDELATAAGVDPIELRVQNDAEAEPESGLRFSSRNLVACLREGAALFGWESRDPRPGIRSDGAWLVGTGVAASTYPARSMASTATVTAQPDGRFGVEIAAADIGTGARTVLTEIAAEELQVPITAIDLRIGDSALGPAMVAGGSMGTASWSWAVVKACRDVLERLSATGGPGDGISVRVDTTDDIAAQEPLARHAFGAQFAEVRVDVGTGEVRVSRLLGVFAAGRIINPTTARSQLVGGMTMGLGMALLEESLMDSQFGDYANRDLAGYHVPTHADVPEIEATWIEEHDESLNPLGVKGIGEIGIVGTAAAIANAVWHATGVRQRELPIRPDRVLDRKA